MDDVEPWKDRHYKDGKPVCVGAYPEHVREKLGPIIAAGQPATNGDNGRPAPDWTNQIYNHRDDTERMAVSAPRQLTSSEIQEAAVNAMSESCGVPEHLLRRTERLGDSMRAVANSAVRAGQAVELFHGSIREMTLQIRAAQPERWRRISQTHNGYHYVVYDAVDNSAPLITQRRESPLDITRLEDRDYCASQIGMRENHVKVKSVYLSRISGGPNGEDLLNVEMLLWDNREFRLVSSIYHAQYYRRPSIDFWIDIIEQCKQVADIDFLSLPFGSGSLALMHFVAQTLSRY